MRIRPRNLSFHFHTCQCNLQRLEVPMCFLASKDNVVVLGVATDGFEYQFWRHDDASKVNIATQLKLDEC